MCLAGLAPETMQGAAGTWGVWSDIAWKLGSQIAPLEGELLFPPLTQDPWLWAHSKPSVTG